MKRHKPCACARRCVAIARSHEKKYSRWSIWRWMARRVASDIAREIERKMVAQTARR